MQNDDDFIGRADPALLLARAAFELIERQQWELGRRAADLALAVDPLQANAHTLTAHLLERGGDPAGALPHWRAAAAIAPELTANRFNLALALLGAGLLEEGFGLQESRLDKPDWSSLAAVGSFAGLRGLVPGPGQDLGAARVLAFTEQGLGDMIWAARFLPALRSRCLRLDLACPPTLRPLLARHVDDGDALSGTVLGPPPELPSAKLNLALLERSYDAFVPMMSLPHVLGVYVAEAEWLVPEPWRVAAYRTRYEAALPGRGPIVGVVWAANPASLSAADRSFPPHVLSALGGDCGARVVNLQGGSAAGRDALAKIVPGCFDPLAGGELPLDDYAALVAATDVLITADTMAAHLSGSMGHRTLVAVPTPANFYWGSTGAETAWYPSLRLFRQAPYAGWAEVGVAMSRAAVAGFDAV